MIINNLKLEGKSSEDIANLIYEELKKIDTTKNNVLITIPENYKEVSNHLDKFNFEGFVKTSILEDKDDKNITIDILGKENFVIAIDGPSASGKSTVAKEIAKILDISYLDTGAMYRAFTYYLLKENISLTEEEIKKVIGNINIDIEKDSVILNGEDISKKIRGDEVTKNVSKVSAISIVREVLVDSQRNISKGKSIVLDGRDIGTVVFPNAKYKFFITATAEERAMRRFKDEKSSLNKSYEEILEDLKARDVLDSNREISPLRQAEDAHLIDSTEMTLREVVEKIINIIRGIDV
ncbi:(d)CMP kinase [Mediannikoviicoccus vaginalis]|uniref:(d)CMP kinase n=1 Tax=Mediannikoviicoccus vaginalis TaxID=2899727 RepID=UPI00210531AB|nr:(d)CMP kinase [Mediannikoviicoccus vaginalis]